MNLVTGGLIEVEDYNDLALEVNKLYSDNNPNLDWATSDLILDYTVVGSTLVAGTPIPFEVANLNLDASQFVVVTVDTGTGWRTLRLSADYSINYTPNPEQISFATNYAIGTQFKVYRRQDHRFGWGQQASIYPISPGDPVLADEEVLQAYLEANINNLIDKVNIMEDRTDGPSELTRIAPRQLIFASDKTTITATIAADITSGLNYWKNERSTVQGNILSFTRTTPWTTQLTATTRWSWDSYDEFRYFFNSGCELRATIITSGSVLSQGYINWNQVATDMGTLVLNYDTCFQTGINGITANLGAYELTEDYQTIFTSGSPSVPVDNEGNFDAYAEYNDLVIVWQARIVEDAISPGSISVDIRAILDDRNFPQTYEGNIEYQAGYTSANDLTDNSADYTITDYLPSLTQQENFTISGTVPSPGTAQAALSSAGFSNGQNVGDEFTVDAGDIIVRIDPLILGNSGVAAYNNDIPIYVAPGETFNTLGTLRINGDGTGSTASVKLTFEPEFGVSVASEVQNVKFRISDIENNLASVNERITVTAYDSENAEVAVTLTPGANLNVVGNVVTSDNVTSTPDQAAHSLLITVPGPVARVEFLYENLGTAAHVIYMSDIVFDIIPLS